MIRHVKPPKYRKLGRSFELLKANWRSMTSDELWPLIRSITVREHLHTTGYFERNFAPERVINSSYLLRRRRHEIARRLRALGCDVSDVLFAHSLPKGRAWRSIVTKWQGPRSNTSLERTRDR